LVYFFPVISDIEDDLGFDPFAETQKALEELIKTEQQQQEVRQQQFLQQQQQQMRQAPAAPFRPPEHSFHNRFSTPPPGFSSVPFREPIPATSNSFQSGIKKSTETILVVNF
jgi:CCR4-NOT transcription complex subunit 4